MKYAQFKIMTRTILAIRVQNKYFLFATKTDEEGGPSSLLFSAKFPKSL